MSKDIGKSRLKFGLLTSPVEAVLPQIGMFKKLGFDYVEVGMEEPAATPRILMEQKNEIITALAVNAMSALGHTAYWVGFGSSHEKVRQGWVMEGKEMVRAASELGISLLNFHFYSRFGTVGVTERWRETFMRNFTNSMRELAQFAAQRGIGLMLENVPPENGHPLESLTYFSQVMSAVPALKFHFDVAHAFIENRMKGVKEYLETFNGRLAHIHMHDNHGKRDEHLPLGEGKIDLRKVVRLLKDYQYNRTVTFEVFTSLPDAVHSRRRFEKIWEQTKNP
ncbi:MAG TPA: sugar phosphate isomerase/epimerase [Candidatus Dormibacteraeota bacterium]|nr:sugar phosphate isomerase/epimerase [Candidatus Dormibacteraeota bacterium]